MSYILEALKRAEADRKAEAAASPARRRPAVIAASRPLWPWLIGGGLVLNALVGGVVFLATRGSSPAVDAPSPIVVGRTETVAERPPATEAPGAEAPRASTPIVEKKVATGGAPLPRRREAPAVAAPLQPAAPTQPLARTQPPAPTQPSSAPTQATVPAPPENREVLARPQPEARVIAAPPPPSATMSLQELASKLRIEVLVWGDDPRDRMVFLNGRKYVEGQALPGGAVIEKIAADGIVLVHEGQRARVQAEIK